MIISANPPLCCYSLEKAISDEGEDHGESEKAHRAAKAADWRFFCMLL